MRKKLDEYVAMTMEQRIEFLEKDRSKIRRENKKLSEENGQLKKELENRIIELERLVRELIQWKEDRQIIQIDKNWKEIWFAIHNYHMKEIKEEE